MTRAVPSYDGTRWRRAALASAALALALLAGGWADDALAQNMGRTGDIIDNFAAEADPRMVLEPEAGAVNRQARGDYPEMQRPSTPLGQIQPAWNYAEPAPGQAQPGVLRIAWRPDRVIQVRTRDFMFTLIQLPPWEVIASHFLGDETTFEVGFDEAWPNILRLRQKYPGADSNLAVLTESGRLISFYVRSEGWNARDISDLAVLVETPPPESLRPPPGRGALPADAARLAVLKAAEVAAESAVDDEMQARDETRAAPPDYLRRLHFNLAALRWTDYDILLPDPEDAAIAPARVFHDGVFTYFDFGGRADTMERPVLHLVIDGVDSPVNTRTGGQDGRILVAEAVGDFTLRAGPRVVCVRYRPGRPALAER